MAKTGQLVPLETIATISKTIGPLAVNHLGQLPAVTISFNLRPGVALGDAMKLVDKLADTELPPTVSTSFQGTAQAFKSSFSGLWLLLAMAIFVIYIVLGVLYESYIHPITILSGLPAAGFGALITLMIFKCDLNIYGFVGIIMLIGIVKKNAIMMIDFALEAERERREEPAGRHLRRGDRPFPADHDDHHGGPDGNPADCHGTRAPAASRGSRWVLRLWAGC